MPRVRRENELPRGAHRHQRGQGGEKAGEEWAAGVRSPLRRPPRDHRRRGCQKVRRGPSKMNSPLPIPRHPGLRPHWPVYTQTTRYCRIKIVRCCCCTCGIKTHDRRSRKRERTAMSASACGAGLTAAQNPIARARAVVKRGAMPARGGRGRRLQRRPTGFPAVGGSA